MRTKKLLLAAIGMLTFLAVNAQTPCPIGTVTPTSATICEGASVTLNASFNNFTRCFTDTVKSVGNQNYQFSSVAVDFQNNVILSGAYSGDINIGVQNIAGFGARDLFVVKYDSCGKLAWVVRGGSALNDQIGNDAGKGIAVDASGNIYVVGRYNQTCSIYGTNGTSYTSLYTNNTFFPSAQDGFLVKISPNGEILWGVTITGGSNDGFNGVTVDAAGNPVVTGSFNGSPFTGNATLIDGNSSLYSVSPGSSNSPTSAVIKFNTNGGFTWMTRLFNKESVTSGVATDGSNFYVTGWFSSNNDGESAQVIDALGGNNNIPNNGIGNAYLLKLNNAGGFVWASNVGNGGAAGSTLTYGNDVTVDGSGNIWLAGFYSGDAFAGLTSSSANSGFLAKFDPAGNSFFYKQLQVTNGNDTKFNGIAVNGSLVGVVGAFKGGNSGGNDIVLVTFDINGNQLNTQTPGGAGDDIGYAIEPFFNGFVVSGTNGAGTTIAGETLPQAGNFLWNTTATGSVTTSILWSTGSTSNSITVSPDATTTYTCTFNDGFTICEVPVTINVTPLVTPIFANITNAICADQVPVPLSNTSDNGITGTWNVAVINGTGSYTFTPDSGQCALPITINITVLPSRRPIFNQPLAICFGSISATLPTTSLNGVPGTWNPPVVDTRVSRCYTFTPNPGICAYDTTICITVIDTFAIFNDVPRNISICYGGTATALPTTSSNNVTGIWSPVVINNLTSGVYTFTPNAGQCAFGHPYRVVVNVTPQTPQPITACYQTASWNPTTCQWDLIGTQPTQPTPVNCWDNYVFDSNTCTWVNNGVQPTQPTPVNCWDNYVFDSNTCTWVNNGVQPTQPTPVNCWDNYVFDSNTCTWVNNGVQPTQPTPVNCWDNYVFDSNTCTWINNGVQPTQPTPVNCWDNYVFDSNTCTWVNNGVQPTQPTPVNCWDNYVFDSNTCTWINNGVQPTQPTPVNCWDNYVFDSNTCTWINNGVQPTQPTPVNCWDNYVFDSNTCTWVNNGVQPTQPTPVNCWDNYVFDSNTCTWVNNGVQPTQPTPVNCWDNYVFDSNTCTWVNNGVQPTQPTPVNCWDNYVFDSNTCTWVNNGVQPTQPTPVNCWDNYVFDSNTCTWINNGVQPTQPTSVNCWDNYVFDSNTCTWVNNGVQPTQPTPVNCWDNYVFDSNTCTWINNGVQPTQPTPVNCWDNYVFDSNTCTWVNNGVQPTQPTPVNCWDNYVFDSNTCTWVNNGVQPTQPTPVNCWDNYVFDSNTCTWINNGVQPTQPTPVNCWDNYVFDSNTCTWVNNGVQPTQPTPVNCWDNYVFDSNTCTWINNGVQPTQPTPVNCWDNYVFDSNTCTWINNGVQPTQPTLECYQTATFNNNTCQWDVTGVPPVSVDTIVIACGSYTWNGTTYNQSGDYTYTYTDANGCVVTDTLHLTINTRIPSTFTPILPICEGSITNINLPLTSLEGTPGTWNPPVSSTNSGCYLFTPDEGYCADTASVCLTILPRLTPAFNNISAEICASNLPVTLPNSSDNGVTGIWTDELGNVITDITTDGWYNFYPNADQCADVYTIYVTIVPVINTDIFPSTNITVSGTSYVLDAGAGYVSYIWNTTETTQTITVTSSGDYSVTVSNGACTVSDNISVLFQNITITPNDTTICEGQQVTLTVNGSQPADVILWSTGDNTSSITVSPASNTTYTVSVNSILQPAVTVNVIPAVQPIFSFITTICAGANVPVLPTTSDNGITGAWSPNVVDANNSNCYTFTPAAGQCASVTQVCVTVNTQPTAPETTVTQPTCTSSTGCITIVSPTGYDYTINGNAASLGTTVCGLNPGVYQIEVSGAGGCNSSAAVTINPSLTVPAAPVVTGEVNVCPFINTGSSLTYTISSPDPTVTQYIWTIPANVVANGTISGPATFTTTNISIDIIIGSGFETQPNKQIRVRAENNCGQSNQTIFYLRTDRPTFPAGVNITASSTDICASVVNQTTIQYCVTPAYGAIGYTWTWGGQTQQTAAPCIDIQFDNAYAGGLLTVTANNICGNSSTESLALPNVQVSPALTVSLVQPTCSVATGTVTVTSPLGAGYEYSIDGGAFQTSNQFEGLSTGDHTITVTHPTICISTASTTITINEQPTVPGTPVVVGTTNICDYICTGNSVTYTVNAPGANYYTWVAPPHGLIDITPVTANGSEISVTFDCGLEIEPNKQIRVIAYNDCGSSELIIYYTAAQAPTMPAGSAIVPSSTDVCAGTPITYSLVPAGTGSSWSWTLPDLSVIVTTIPSITLPSIPEGGQLCVRVKNSCGESEPRCINIPSITSSVPSTPGIISGPTVVCSNVQPNGTCATYSVNPIAGVSYNWSIYSPSTGSIPVAGSGNTVCILFPAGFNGGSVQVSGTNGCGTGGVRTLNIPVRTAAPAPVYIIQQPDCNSTTGSVVINSPASSGYEYVLSNGTVISYPANTFTGLTPGTYELSVQNPSLCQLATTVSITINPQPVYTSTLEASICEGSQYDFPWGGSTSEAGTYVHVYIATDGCDSTVTLNLTVNPVYNSTTTAAICDNQYYTLPWLADPVNQPGTYTHTYTTINGCDSVVNIELTVNPTYNQTIEISTCDNVGFELPWDGTIVYQSGIYTHQYTSQNGCDSIVNYNVTVHPTYNINIDAGICDNQTYPLPWGGNVSDQGVYTHTYTTVYGCDSIVNIHLYVYPTFDVTVPVSICEGQTYELPWGETVSTSGVYTHLYTTTNGCDSIVHYEVTVNPLPSVPVADLIQPTCTVATGCINITDPVGSNYSYSLNGGTSQTTPSFCNLVAGTYEVAVINENGCISTSTFTINEQPVIPPVPTGLSGIVNVCTYMGTGQALTYCVSPLVPTATAYIWTLPPNVTTVNGETGTFTGGECINILIPAGFNAQPNKQIRVRAENECGASGQYIFYMRTDRPTFPVGVIITASGNDVCGSIVNQTPIQYCVTPAIDAISYVWTWNGGTVTTNAPCASITFNSGYNGGQLTVYAVNECGVSSTETFNLPVITIAPSIDVAVEQPTCTIATGTITINSPVGSGYSYSLDGGPYQSSNQFTSVPTGTHTISVQHSTICVIDNEASVTIDEQPRIPDAPLVGSTVNICQFICQDTVIRYTANAYGADMYHWTLPPHGLITIETANADSSEVYLKFHCGLELQPNKQVKVTASNECGTSLVRIYYLQAQPPTLPAASTIAASGINSCNGGEVIYTLSPAGAGPLWQWTLPDGTDTTTSTPSITLPAIASGGQLCVKVKNNCGLSNARCFNIPSFAAQTPSTPGIISGPSLVCGNIAPNGTCANYSVNPIAGVTYNWSLVDPNNGTINLPGNGNSVCILFPAGFNGGSVQVTATNACGTGGVRSFNIPVRPAASNPVVSVDQPNCTSETGTVTINAPLGSGFEYVLNGNVISYPNVSFESLTPGTYTVFVQNPSTCLFASSSSFTVNPQPVYSSSMEAVICEGQSYVLPWGDLASISGQYVHNYTAADGCDSTVTVTLTVNPTYNVNIDAAICEGQSYDLPWGGQVTTAGTYSNTTTTVNGCDSTVTVTLTVNPTYNVNIDAAICEGQSYDLPWGGQVTTAGTYSNTTTTMNGCDSTVTVTLSVNPTYNVNIDAAICEGQSYDLPWGGQVTTAGTYSNTTTTVNGCDSTVTVTLTVNPTYNVNIDAAICEGQSYDLPWGGQVTTAGTYSNTTTTMNGCDSTVTVTLTVNPTYNVNIDAAICEGQSYDLPWGGQVTTAGTYSNTTTTVNGCDSTVTVTLTVNPTYNVNIDAAICEGQSYDLPWGGQVTTAGTYSNTTTTVNGCDSTVTVTLTINPTYNVNIDAAICEGQSYDLPWGGQVTTAGTYSNTTTTVNGCDSTVTVTLTVNPLPVIPQFSLTQPTCTIPTGCLNYESTIGSGDSYTIDNDGIALTNPQTCGLATGMHTIYSTNQWGCVSGTVDFEILPQPTVPMIDTITGIKNICSYIGETLCYEVQPFEPGAQYNWVLPPTGIDQVTTAADGSSICVVFNPDIVNAPNKQIRLTATNACGSSDLYILYLRADLPSAPGLIAASGNDICASVANQTSIDYSISSVYSASGYCWTLPAGATTASPVCPTQDLSISVTYNSLYQGGNLSVHAINGCGSGPDRVYRLPNVTQSPAPELSYLQTDCNNATVSVTVTSPVAAGYLYSIDNGTMQTDPVFENVGAGLHTISVNNVNGCLSQNETSFVINEQPVIPAQPGVPSGESNLCPYIGTSTELTYTINPVAGAVSYVWSADLGIDIVSGNGTNSINITVNGSYAGGTIYVYAVNPCGNSPVSTAEIVPSAPSAPIGLTGSTSVCQSILNGSMILYSITPVPSATNYIWDVPGAQMIINSGDHIEVLFPSTFTSGTVSVSYINGCGTSAPATLNVVSNVDATQIEANLQLPSCGSPNGCISIASPINTAGQMATYEYSLDGNQWQSTIDFCGLNSGNYQLQVRRDGYCLSNSQVSLTLNDSNIYPDNLDVSGEINVCEYINTGARKIYAVSSSTTNVTYDWIAPPVGLNIIREFGPNNDSVEVEFVSGFDTSSNKQLKVFAQNECGLNYLIYYLRADAPSNPGFISGPVNVCEFTSETGNAATYTIPPVFAATGYTWVVPDGVAIISGQGTDSVTLIYPVGFTGGTVIVIATNNCGSVTRSIRINACTSPFAGNNTPVVTGKKEVPSNDKESLKLKVFPNPSPNQFNLNVSSTSQDQLQVRIMDLHGRLIKTFKMKPSETIQFGNEMMTGSYFVEVMQNGKKVTDRIIKF